MTFITGYVGLFNMTFTALVGESFFLLLFGLLLFLMCCGLFRSMSRDLKGK